MRDSRTKLQGSPLYQFGRQILWGALLWISLNSGLSERVSAGPYTFSIASSPAKTILISKARDLPSGSRERPKPSARVGQEWRGTPVGN